MERTIFNTEVVALTFDLLEAMGQDDPLLNERRMSGPAYAYLLDGKPIAAAGLGRVAGRRFFAWCMMGPEIGASKLLMRRLMREIRNRYPIIRDLIKAESVEVETLDNPKFYRWLELFGFNRLPIVRYGWERNGPF